MNKQYVIAFHKNTKPIEVERLFKKYNIEVDTTYQELKRHYVISTDDNNKTKIKAEPIVIHITEADAPVELVSTQEISVNNYAQNDNWGLLRICKTIDWNNNSWFPISGSYNYFKTGEGVDVYIIDTGIKTSHVDFEDRAETLYDYYNSPGQPEYGIDFQGHGTHVASSVAGKRYGVAKKAKVISSKIFNKGGATVLAVISGIEACLEHHENKKKNNVNRPSIMNLSIGGPKMLIEEIALNDCIDAGIVCVAAAGNDGMDLDTPGYDVFPAEIERAITVGASDIRDRIATFSNWGKMIDVFAPGVHIAGAWIHSNTSEATISGTSMAAPHVAGVCALRCEGMDLGRNDDFVHEIHDWIVDVATNNKLLLHESANTSLTPNKKAFSFFIEDINNEPEQPIEEPIEQPVEEPVEEPKGKGKKEGGGRRLNKTDKRYITKRTKLDRIVSELLQEINSKSLPMYQRYSINELDIVMDELALAIDRDEIIKLLATFFEIKNQVAELVQ